ncbi:MAG TPA: multidrug effflux MFS transporter [Ferrovibrio sp.]|uniref:multidrug effflux MFS transporter n=1 Tax=Ferrovibrio sp. TaxID=1917215 RepID=UPI002B4ACE4D|nr:multidrug effflux MFS transporter [Ferrovibrio sp.]HLT78498.1 multidrug effflux MFS transporter [Ferrovibrio sp.]
MPRPGSRPSLAVLVAMSALGPMALNIFMPSMPGLAVTLGIDYGAVQLTLTLYLIGLGVAQLVYGPLSDRYGRRPVLLCGLAIFFAGSTICAAASSIEVLVLGRMLQAIGGCSGLVLGRAIIRDLHDRDSSAAMIGYVTMAMTLAPMLAPALGGYLDIWMGWRASFAFCSLAGAIVFLWVLLVLPETLQPGGGGEGIAGLLRGYRDLLRSPAFCGYALQTAFTSGMFFAFIAGAPFVVVTVLGLPPSSYGLWFVVVSIGYLVGNFLTGRFSVRFGIDRMIAAGATIALVGIATQAVTGWLGLLSLPAIFLPMAVVALSNGLTLPNGTAGAVSVNPRAAGAAAGLSGALQMLVGAAAAVIVGYGQDIDPSQYPMIWTMMASGILSVLAFLVATRMRARAGWQQG